jgi:hypothetical protein
MISTGETIIPGQIVDLGVINRPRLAPMLNDCSAERSQVFTMCGSYAKYDRDWSTAMFANVCAWAEIAINAVQSPNSIMPRQERFMFTQQHYEKIADLMHSERVKLRRLHGPKYTETPELLALNDMTMGFVAMFNKDNPKFRELIFIGRCNRDLHENS